MKRKELIFRVFISSTFSDMKAERDALLMNTFPKLREYCQKLGARFQALDLRWGVSQEAALDQQTMNICFEELKRCQRLSPKPNFIILLGQRYGWRPLPVTIPATVFERIIGIVAITSTDSEAEYTKEGNLLDKWYRRDDNAVPPAYVLLARDPGGPYADYEKWQSIEQAMQKALCKGAAAIGLTGRELLPYFTSATHQEIEHGAFQAPEVEKHIFAYLRSIKEVHEESQRVGEFIDLPDSLDAKDGGALRDRIIHDLPVENVLQYAAVWKDVVRRSPPAKEIPPTLDIEKESDIKVLCDRVYDDLRKVIDAELNDFIQADDLKREQDAHRDFGRERCTHFEGRKEVLGQIDQYLNDPENHKPLVIHGVSGCGKTALMAQAIEKLKAESGKPKCIFRFIGATPESADLRSLLTSLCRELGVTEIPTEINDLIRCFRGALAGVSTEVNRKESLPTVIFIDALDQLNSTDSAGGLYWLPRMLAPRIKLVVTTLETDGDDGLPFRQAVRLWPDSMIEVGRLGENDAKDLLKSWLADAERTLTQKQSEYLLQQFEQSGSPLYLKVAFEEARRWHSWQNLPNDLDGLLQDSVAGVLNDMLSRLEHKRHHGRQFVEHALSAIAVAKNGLTEDELIDIMSDNPDVMESYRERNPDSPPSDHLPTVIWSRLYADLKPYLCERRADGTIVINFYHRQVAIVAKTKYLHVDNAIHAAHESLRLYYEGQWNDLRDGIIIASGRIAKGIAYHAWRSLAHDAQQIEDLLLHPCLFETWAHCGYTFELNHDLPICDNTSECLKGFLNAWKNETLWIERFPDHVCQIILNAFPGATNTRPFLGRLEAHLKRTTTTDRGFCLACTKNIYVQNLAGNPLPTPFDKHNLYFETEQGLGIINLESGVSSLFDIPMNGVTRATISSSGNAVLVAYRLRRPSWEVFDCFGKSIGDGAVVHNTESEISLTSAFLGQWHILSVSNRALRVMRLPSFDIEFEYLWSSGLEAIQCDIIGSGDDAASIGICLKDKNNVFARAMQIQRQDDKDVSWNLNIATEKQLDRRVSHICGNHDYAVFLSIDRQVHLLPTDTNSKCREGCYQLPNSIVRAFSSDDEWVYFSKLDIARVFRLNIAGGWIEESDILPGSPYKIEVTKNRVCALIIPGLISLDLDCFHSISDYSVSNSNGHVLHPEPIQQLRISPAGRNKILIGSTQTVGAMNYSSDITWFTPSHCPIIDASAREDGVIYTLDSEGSVYRCEMQSSCGEKLFQAGGTNRIFGLNSTIACCPELSMGQWEVVFYSERGVKQGSWSNSCVRGIRSDLITIDMWDNEHLAILLISNSISPQRTARIVVIDNCGRVVHEYPDIRFEPADHKKLRSGYFVQWNTVEVIVQDTKKNAGTLLHLTAPELGALRYAEIFPAEDGDLLFVSGQLGSIITDLPRMQRRYTLPGIKPPTKAVLLDDSRLCLLPAISRPEIYKLT